LASTARCRVAKGHAMTDRDFDLLLAQTRARLDKLTRPVFEREVVEALIDALDRRQAAPPPVEASDADEDDWDRPLSEREQELEDEIDTVRQQFHDQSIRANRLEQALAETQRQAHAFATQIQWFLDATPEAREARLTYLREMQQRLGEADMPQDSAVQSR